MLDAVIGLGMIGIMLSGLVLLTFALGAVLYCIFRLEGASHRESVDVLKALLN